MGEIEELSLEEDGGTHQPQALPDKYAFVSNLVPQNFGYDYPLRKHDTQESAEWTLRFDAPQSFEPRVIERNRVRREGLVEKRKYSNKKAEIKKEFSSDFTNVGEQDAWWMSDDSDNEDAGEERPSNDLSDLYFDYREGLKSFKKHGAKTSHKEIKFSEPDDTFDPSEDERNMEWANNMRYYNHTGVMPSKRSENKVNVGNDYRNATANAVEDVPTETYTSDAILSCPCCFATLCIDCQRHQDYPDQFRAMFVQNCKVDTSRQLMPQDEYKDRELETAQELYYPVYCRECGETQVAVYDVNEEVYHFFHVIPSNA